MSIKVLATIGPSSLNRDTIEKLSSNGVDLFRINLSHTKLDDVAKIIDDIHSWTDVPICLDSEGAQVRNQDMESESVEFQEGSVVKIHHIRVIGDSGNMSFTPNTVSKQLKVGDTIRIDFNALTLKVIEDKGGYLLANVETSGSVGSNKAADVDRDIDLDAVTHKDREAFKIGLEKGVKNFSLSFTHTASNVKDMRDIIGDKPNLISKIESIKGVLNLKEILPLVDQILIDRGDLSREVSIDKIPFIQRRIISYAKSKDVPVYVATNLLESMIHAPSPTRAEVNDVASTLLMGANGLVLAAETAIGKHPVETVKMVNLLIKQYARWTPDSTFKDVIFN
jgi:pyruvate kinase